MEISIFSNFGKRYLQILLVFTLGFLAYGMRAILSVAIVAMISKTPPDPSIPTYPEWSNKDIILASFFCGYIVFQILAGQLAERFGPKWFLTISFAIASISCLLVPVMAATFGSGGVIASRFVTGLSQGFLYPSIHIFLSRWSPLEERTRIATFVYAGSPLGTFTSMPVTGLISDSSVGWPVTFYLYGTLGLIWSVFFAWLGCNSPTEHSTISITEVKYIQGNRGSNGGGKQKLSTPWKSILTSTAVWAILMAHVGENWGFYTLLTEIPSYMNNVLKYKLTENSFLSAVPYLASFLLSLVISPISDTLINRKILSIEASRKIFNSIGFFLPAIALVFLGYVPTDQKELAVTILIIAVGTNAGNYCGFNLNHIDIAPNYAGTLMGMSNMLSNIGSLLAPLLVQFIVTDEEDQSMWRIIFFLASGVYVVTAIFFVIFGSGKVQEWNDFNTTEMPNPAVQYDHNPQITNEKSKQYYV